MQITLKDNKVRITCFLIVNCILLFFYFPYVKNIVYLSRNDETQSHLILMPFISIFFFFSMRKKIFRNIKYDLRHGMVLFAFGLLLLLFISRVNQNLFSSYNLESLAVISGLLCWMGGFICFFGFEPIKTEPFPFLLLLLTIPIPEIILKPIIHFLQWGSTQITFILFKATRIEFYRDGYFFHLPQITIKVAEECSGIRSSIALFITSLIAGHLFLKTLLQKSILSVFVIPITLFKNALRIVTLTLLGAYVDRDILSSNVHRQGGKPFFLLAFLLLIIVLLILRKLESTQKQSVK